MITWPACREKVEEYLLRRPYSSVISQLTDLQRELSNSTDYFIPLPISSSLGRRFVPLAPSSGADTASEKSASPSSALIVYSSLRRLNWYEEVEDVRHVLEQSLRLKVCLTSSLSVSLPPCLSVCLTPSLPFCLSHTLPPCLISPPALFYIPSLPVLHPLSVCLSVPLPSCSPIHFLSCRSS